MAVKYKLFNDDCLQVLKGVQEDSVDLVLTSPPYDDLRTYNGVDGFSFSKFQEIAKSLYKVVKIGGCVVWVVGDSTSNHTESGTSFKQALYFMEIGFNLYDTMIFEKENPFPINHRRYQQCFEYMFVLSKGKPQTFNPIMVPTQKGGCLQEWVRKSPDEKFPIWKKRGLVSDKRTIKDKKIHTNIFSYVVGQNRKWKHPATFPKQLAVDVVNTWSNEGDLIMDCFMGSGTTGEVALELGRNFFGIEIDKNYCAMAAKRIEEVSREIHLF